MPPPQRVDGVEEDEVTRCDEEEKHTGGTRVYGWKRKEIYFKTGQRGMEKKTEAAVLGLILEL